ncbi:MAG TPA: GlsB/YeaQ/YmgE family stress response membrane protein [Candidatus Limnocylindria bacterium]|nr:GlsB/YeaQ/YmgE family stress response membrane protein [Candidatus Limnocylindria bacterium]
MNLLIWALFGAIAGFIAARLMGEPTSLLGDIVLGIVGAIVGGFVAGLLGINYNAGFSIEALLVAIVGAILVIFLVRRIRA